MSAEKEMTALDASVGADAGQSSHINCLDIIPDSVKNINGDDDISFDIPDIGDPGYLPVISMQELYNSVYQSRPPITVIMTFCAEVAAQLDSLTNAPFKTNYSLHVSNHLLKSIADKVLNCLMEWTLKLEEKGILGENMTFNETESTSAKEIPQQVNYYYGTIIHGDVSSAQIVSGNSNSIAYNATAAADAVQDIRESLERENLSKEDMESAIELLDEISEKIAQNKKPGIIKSALIGLKDFVLSVGADLTAALIAAKIQGMF